MPSASRVQRPSQPASVCRQLVAQLIQIGGVQAEAGFHNWACFLAEQSAQLSAKGLLHGLGAGGWGHDLVELGQRWAEVVGAGLGAELSDALQPLSRHYIPPRYPDAHPAGSPGAHYGQADSAHAVADAEHVAAAANSAWERCNAEAGG